MYRRWKSESWMVEKTRELILLELKNIRRSRVEMDVVPAVLFESFFIFLNFYSELWSQWLAFQCGASWRVLQRLKSTDNASLIHLTLWCGLNWSIIYGPFIMKFIIYYKYVAYDMPHIVCCNFGKYWVQEESFCW